MPNPLTGDQLVMLDSALDEFIDRTSPTSITVTGCLMGTAMSILELLAYKTTSSRPATTGRTVQVQVQDYANNGLASPVKQATATVTVQIEPYNDPPVIELKYQSMYYTEGSGHASVLEDILVADPESRLVKATVTLSGAETYDTLSSSNVSVLFDTSRHVATFPESTASDLMSLLASLRFQCASSVPSLFVRTLNVEVEDNGIPGNNIGAKANSSVSIFI